jgi:recombination protein RecA
VLPIDLGQLGSILPGGGLPRGGVVELAVTGGAAMATRIALSACRAVQQEALVHGGELPWCAFLDPSASLFAPGVAKAGVELKRLLVVRPNLDALTRVAVRLAESRAFAVLVVDTIGVPGASLTTRGSAWVRTVRRLALAAEGTASIVLLLTEHMAQRGTPLPVAQRILLSRPAPDLLRVQLVKDRHGRVGAPRTVAFRANTEAQSIRPARERSAASVPFQAREARG